MKSLFIATLLIVSLLRHDTGIITNVNNGLVTVKTADCNEWQFYGTGYNTNEKVIVYFDTNETKMLYDDEITNVIRN